MANLTVYCGPMFAQKTTGLLMECENARLADCIVAVYKPQIDNRYSEEDIVSHDGIKASDLGFKVNLRQTIWTMTREEIKELKSRGVSLVAIDEIQFFNFADSVVSDLLNANISVVCSGLDMDSSGAPFGKMGELLSLADVVHKQKAACAVCGESAGKTFRKLTASQETVLIGGKEVYEPRCSTHWRQGMKEWLELVG